MNPSSAAIDTIRAHVADWTPADAEIVDALNVPSIDNPTPAATIAKSWYASILKDSLTPESVARLNEVPWLPAVVAEINAGNAAGVALYAEVLAAGAKITPDEFTAIMATLTATETDPNWPSQISWAQANLGRPVDIEDIAAARVE